MTGRDLVKMLEWEAKRRPVVAEMLSRCSDLTDEEIDTAVLPLPWFRRAFREARERYIGMAALTLVREVAKANPLSRDDVVEGANAVKGWVAEYTGPSAFFKSVSGFDCEVKSSAWLFFPETGGVWDYQTFFSDIPREFEQNRKLMDTTRHGYVLAWADELRRRY